MSLDSEFQNNNKIAKVRRTSNGFAVDLFIDHKPFQTVSAFTVDEAESIAEDFVLNADGSPQFLTE